MGFSLLWKAIYRIVKDLYLIFNPPFPPMRGSGSAGGPSEWPRPSLCGFVHMRRELWALDSRLTPHDLVLEWRRRGRSRILLAAAVTIHALLPALLWRGIESSGVGGGGGGESQGATPPSPAQRGEFVETRSDASVNRAVVRHGHGHLKMGAAPLRTRIAVHLLTTDSHKQVVKRRAPRLSHSLKAAEERRARHKA